MDPEQALLLKILWKALEKAMITKYEFEEYFNKNILPKCEKVIDSAGRVIVRYVFHIYDSEGELVSDDVVFTFDSIIPLFYDGYCLCNNGDEIGLGLPQYKIIDGAEIADILFSDTVSASYNGLSFMALDDTGDIMLPDVISGNDDCFLVDLDDDGAFDDVLVPLPDFTGDGQSDWGWLVDDDDNGLPDVSPYSPFYPVGSEGYHEIVERVSDSELPFMDKPFEDFTVTEGLLFLIFLCVVGSFIGRLFKRRVKL